MLLKTSMGHLYHGYVSHNQRVSGWWFGIFFFLHILGIVTPTDFHIFQRGWNHQPDIVDDRWSLGWVESPVRFGGQLYSRPCKPWTNILTYINSIYMGLETVDSNVASLKRCQVFLMISSTQKQQMKPSYGSQGSHGMQALSGLNGEYGVYATGPSRDDISVDPEKVRHFFLQVKGYYLGYPNPKSLWISICSYGMLWNAMECYGAQF